MHRTDGDGHVGNMFTEGDPILPTPATLVTAAWSNAVQEELALTIEGLGGTLVKGTNNQLLTRLNAKYGRLDLANTWAGAQTMSSTLGVTGNVSLGGSFSVTASSTFTGPATLNGTTRVNASLGVGTAPSYPLDVRQAPTGNAFARIGLTGTPAVLLTADASGFLGLNFNTYFTTQDVREVTGYASAITAWNDGSIRIRTGGGSGAAGSAVAFQTKVTVHDGVSTSAAPLPAMTLSNGHLSLDGVPNPNSNVAVKNALTPQHIVKAHCKATTNGSGGGTVNGGTGIASVTASGGVVTVTFAQAFANADYDATITMHASIYSVATITAQTANSVSFQAVDMTLGQGGAMTGVAVQFGSNARSFSVMAAGAQ